MIAKHVPDQKFLNPLYLEEKSVMELVRSSETLVDIGFILDRHLSKKVRLRDVDYAEPILQTVKNKTEELLLSSQYDPAYLLCASYGHIFQINKNSSSDSRHQISEFEHQNCEDEIMLIFNLVIRPLLEKKTIEKVYSELESMVYWFIILRERKSNKDRLVDRELFLQHVAKKINSFLWTKKTSSNFTLIKTFNIVMELLSIKYLPEDSFSYEGLAPVLNRITADFPLKDLINNWLGSQ